MIDVLDLGDNEKSPLEKGLFEKETNRQIFIN